MSQIVMAALIALIVLSGVAPAVAQNTDTLIVAQEGGRRTLFDMLFGDEPAPAPVVEQPQRPRQQPRQPSPQQAEAPVLAEPEVDKSPDAVRLAVFGDSLAVDLSRALERFYADDPNLVVIDQGVANSGFVRDDFFDWDTAIGEQIAADSFDFAVVMIGVNDRQEIITDGIAYDSLTDRWDTLYQARINDFLSQLRAARKPVIWVGLPPMAKTEYSAAINQISNIQRLSSFSGGAEFLEIYERFLGEDGKFSAYGPDVNGQNARMRKDDGIHFATAGADKLAFYLSQSIGTFYNGGAVSVAAADPLLGTDGAGMLRPPYQGLGQTRLLEVAGAVIPLSRVPPRANGLLAATGAGATTAPFTLDQLMTAPTGRADAFGVGIDPEAEPTRRGAQP